MRRFVIDRGPELGRGAFHRYLWNGADLGVRGVERSDGMGSVEQRVSGMWKT